MKTAHIINEIIPQWMSGLKVKIISYKTFQKGKPATESNNSGISIYDVQNFVFVQYLEGPHRGKVDFFNRIAIRQDR
jgi:hypothetical protein